MINLSINVEESATVIKEFIKTYVYNSGCGSVVIGLSGGVDSAVTAVLCKEALGPKQVHCLFLPDEATPDVDRKHVNLITKTFDMSCEETDITSLVEKLTNTTTPKPDKYACANMKARARMILLFAYANIHNCLVCGTSNKSEILLGYFTK